MKRPIATLEEFYAHAIAIEREAMERYREFQAWFADRSDEILAGLCANIGRMEEKHYRALTEASRSLALPAIAAREYLWLEAGSPEAPARELFYRVAEPRHLLEIALEGERNALAFFQWVARSAPDKAVRAAAAEMARDEEVHVRCVRNALEYHVASRIVDWDEVFDAGAGPGSLSGGA